MMVIRAIGEDGLDGPYLMSYDPDGHDGIGDIVWTWDLVDAMYFADAIAALTTYRMQSTVCPRRDDGKPNRPLTAFTVSMEPI